MATMHSTGTAHSVPRDWEQLVSGLLLLDHLRRYREC